MAKIKAEYLLERQGKQFALFAGLLDAAHSEGLKSIDTALLQIGDPSNGDTWIFRAVVETEKGRFSAHGDASPANVSKQMLTVLPRMAETRSIARALRFAVNSNIVAADELSDDDDTPHQPTPRPAPATPAPERPAPRPQPPTGIAPPPQQAQPQGMNLATPAQVRAIYSIARDTHNLSEREVDERTHALFGAAPVDLTRKQASEFIESLRPRQGGN